MKILRKLFHFKCKPSGICFEKATKSKTIEEKFEEKSSKEEEEEEAPVAGNRKPFTTKINLSTKRTDGGGMRLELN